MTQINHTMTHTQFQKNEKKTKKKKKNFEKGTKSLKNPQNYIYRLI